MKKKDLNTFINDELAQGNGLPFKEEYWSDMNELLDVNMPIIEPSLTVAKFDLKGIISGLKLLFLFLGSAILGASVYFYFQISPTQSSSSQTSSVETSISQSSTSFSPEAKVEANASSNLSASLAPIRFKPNGFKRYEPMLDKTKSNYERNTFNNTNAARLDKKNELVAPIENENLNTPRQVNEGQNKNEKSEGSMFENDASLPAENSLIFENRNANSLALVRTNNNTFSMISPLNLNLNNKFVGDLPNQIPIKQQEEQSQLIKHLAVSPFIGFVRQIQNQAITNGQQAYLIKPQTNLIFGVQAEAIFSHFGIRSGISWSETTLLSQLTSQRDLYQVDTSYIIINPNYGKTLSGKPVALIKRQLDSTYISTENHTIENKLTYTYITIPLALQYHLSSGRFGILVEAGALHQFGLNNLPSNEENKISLPSYTMQFTAGAGLRYAFDLNWAIGVQYNYAHNSMSGNILVPSNSHIATFMISRAIW